MRIEVYMLKKHVKITKIANYFIFNYLRNVLFKACTFNKGFLISGLYL